MPPKISEGQDETNLIAEAKALAENGWALDNEEMGVKKTYYFKTYTKALVRSIIRLFKSLLLKPLGFLVYRGSEKQIEESSFGHDYRKIS